MITDAELYDLIEDTKKTCARGPDYGWTHTFPNGNKATFRYNRSTGRFKINTNPHWMEYKYIIGIIKEMSK